MVTILPDGAQTSSDAATFAPPRVPTDRPGPDGGRRDVNRRQRLNDLCSGALDRFLEVGLDAVTVDDVVRAAGLSKGSFYRYFDSKDQLVDTVFAPLRHELEAAMAAGADALERAPDADALIAAYQTFAIDVVALLGRHERLTRLYLQERAGPARAGREPIRALADAIRHHATRMTSASRAHGLLREVDPLVSALLVVGAVHELLDAQQRGLAVGDPIIAAATLIDVVLHGLRSSPERHGAATP